jgi:hypothetical protein
MNQKQESVGAAFLLLPLSYFNNLTKTFQNYEKKF